MIVEFCKRTGFSYADILGDSRKGKLRKIRGVYMVILKKNGYSFHQITAVTNKCLKTVCDSINETVINIDRKNPFVLDLYLKVKDIKKIEAPIYRKIMTK